MFSQAGLRILSTGEGVSASGSQGDIPPLGQTPPRQTPPWTDTPSPRRPLLQTVRILLECILVLIRAVRQTQIVIRKEVKTGSTHYNSRNQPIICSRRHGTLLLIGIAFLLSPTCILITCPWDVTMNATNQPYNTWCTNWFRCTVSFVFCYHVSIEVSITTWASYPRMVPSRPNVMMLQKVMQKRQQFMESTTVDD